MKKEVLIAILLGFGIGLIVTFGIYQRSRSSPNSSSQPQTTSASDQPSPTPLDSLTISSPENLVVVNQDAITITGSSQPEAYITVVSETLEDFTQADSTGQFNLEVRLQPGPNILTITSLSQNRQESLDLTITYTTGQTQEIQN